jgi:cytochrome oxidase assembly protein ShyY1
MVPNGNRRRFRPQWWGLVLAVLMAALMIRLGNWQGERAGYKLSQQAQLDASLAAPPISLEQLRSTPDAGQTLRYRQVAAAGSFVEQGLFFVDNRIHDGKAGYVALQLFSLIDVAGENSPRFVLVDRGWVAAPAERQNLPKLTTPADIVNLQARVNVPQSRNPGTFDNDAGIRLNYINIDELAQRTGKRLEPYVLELTGGPGFTGVGSVPPGTNFEKNRIYQMQWYAFAALAVILFVVLSFRRQEPS